MGTASERRVGFPSDVAEEESAQTVLLPREYVTLLHRAVLEAESFAGRSLIVGTAAEVAFAGFTRLPAWSELAEGERLLELARQFGRMGLGRLKAVELTPSGGIVDVEQDSRPEPVEHDPDGALWPLVEGVVQGAAAAVFERGFEVGARGESGVSRRFRLVSRGEIPAEPEHYPIPPGATPPYLPPPAIREKLGEVDAGQLFTRSVGLWADYPVKLANRFQKELPRLRGSKFAGLPAIVLTEAAHRGTYAAFGSLLRGTLWRDVVEGAGVRRDEWLDALVEIVNGLGWGSWRVESMVPGERLTLRVYDSYEAVGFRRHFGRSSVPRCYHARGVVAGIMNLLHLGDLLAEPELGPSHYNRLFRSPFSFRALETRCRAGDDPYCEFVVNPLSPVLSSRVPR